ncbi:hypothetical protein BDZ45DRAFT_801150 [Acephala macrosclerotiorum]|nr:hypothetical protein BDZ45DRAFT_801150 [Acephala macrosclerotiorum]
MPPSTFSTYPGTWHVQYSSRKLWHGKRNVQAKFTASDSLEYTYQEQEISEIKAHEETDWKVVGNGKDGKLETWMTETEGGIEDTSGEIRADCRSHWMTVIFPLKSDTFYEVDILCSRQKRISDETVKDILSTLKSKGDQFPELKEMVLLTVSDDGARNAEMKKAEEQRRREWEKRTGKEEGISEDLVYDDVEEKEVSRYRVQ